MGIEFLLLKLWIRLLVVFCSLSTAVASHGQVESGDSEISFLGFYSTVVGVEGSSGGFGSVQLSYGYFLTPNLQIGLGPNVTFSGGTDGTEVSFSGSAFFTFNFSTSGRSIPYISAQYYQFDFDIPEGQSFTDLAYINVGLGMRSFFSEFAALNTSVNYGFSLAENAEGGLLLIQSGLSFIF
jgi:hypothetical protein